MTCQECELLLAGEEDALVQDHVRDCAMCRALRDELRANALALSSMRDDELPKVMPKRRAVIPPAVPWIAAAAAAVLLALMARQELQRQSPHPQPVPAHVTVTAELPAASEPAPGLVVRRRKSKRAPRSGPLEQPLLVKMLTPDPDVVVYWMVD